MRLSPCVIPICIYIYIFIYVYLYGEGGSREGGREGGGGKKHTKSFTWVKLSPLRPWAISTPPYCLTVFIVVSKEHRRTKKDSQSVDRRSPCVVIMGSGEYRSPASFASWLFVSSSLLFVLSVLTCLHTPPVREHAF